jgi:hypothetical protein
MAPSCENSRKLNRKGAKEDLMQRGKDAKRQSHFHSFVAHPFCMDRYSLKGSDSWRLGGSKS